MSLDTGLELGFRSVEREHAGERVPVEGHLPDWLDGALLRNGPARFDVGGERVAHWFDGLGMLTRFGIDGAADEVVYANRFLRSEAYRTATEEGRLPSQFGSGGSWLRRVYDLLAGTTTDNCNVHVARLDGTGVALTEVPRYVAFDGETLATDGEFAFEDDLSGSVNTAHLVPDPHRGETVGLLTDYRERAYRLYRVPDGSRRRRLVAELEAGKPAYVHSFAVGSDHVVLTEHPFVVDPRSFLTPGGEGFVDFFDWEPGRGTTFHVIDRETGAVVAAPTADPFFVFHHVNAFEVDGEIVVDLVAYPDSSVVSGLYLDDVRAWFEDGVDGELRRYRIPLDGGDAAAETLYDGVELPRVAAGDRTRRHRYVFGQGAAEADGNHLAKVDVASETATRWAEPGTFVEEPVFVRAPGVEPPADGGVVLATALNANEERTDLLVVDAGSMDLLARAPLPHAIPFGFHGRYAPGG
ncbi:MAG: carotenoid oxygenase family protein [Halobacteriales archaeon]